MLRDKILKNLEESSKDLHRKKKERKSVIDQAEEHLKAIYKQYIRKNRERLLKMVLTKEEVVAVDYLDFNPHIMLILDDCASRFKEWSKKTIAFKEIFYEGRQWFITTVISFQDDKEISSELRKGSMVTILTTDQIANMNFKRESNGYGKPTFALAQKCIDAVFRQDTSEEHFRKLVYIQGAREPFRYLEAKIYEDYKMGCAASWKFSEKTESHVDKKNSLADKIALSYGSR
jgi:hypothetical protein